MLTKLASKLTIKPLLWAIAILLGLVLALSGALWLQHATHAAEVETLQASVTTLEGREAQASGRALELADANSSQMGVITDLLNRLQAAIKSNERLDELLTEAETRAAVAARERADALNKLNAEKERMYATDPTCSAWGRAAVCAGISGGLQQQWEQARSAAPAGQASGGGSPAPAAGGSVR